MTTTTSLTAEGPWLEALSVDECLRLVKGSSVGRFAVALPDQAPLVVPVNYVVQRNVVVFRSDEGAKVFRLRQQPASFQVDLIDPVHHTGWSVLIRGVAYEATRAEVEGLDLTSWVGERDRWIRILPTSVTGRRIRLAEVAGDCRGYL